MKRLLHCILIVLLLSVAISCRHRQSDPRLTRIDAKIEKLYGNRIDTAKMMLDSLNAIDVTTLLPHDRAYHAMLTALAMYKAYIPATSDSIINVAYDYWTANCYDDTLYARTMLYKGNVLNEIGRHDSAMYYYKRVEQMTAGNPYYHGMALLRQAELIQHTSVTTEAVNASIQKYMQARNDFEQSGARYYWASATMICGYYYNRVSVDTALIMLNQALQEYKKLNEPSEVGYAYDNIAVSYFQAKDYRHAIDALNTVIANKLPLEREHYYYLIRSHIHLQQLDSAEYYMQGCPQPVTPKERMGYLNTLTDLAYANGDSLLAEQYYRRCDSVADSLYAAQANVYNDEVDNAMERERATHRETMFKRWGIVGVVALLAMLAGIALVYFRNRRRQGSLLDQLQRLKQESDQQIEQLSRKLEQAHNGKDVQLGSTSKEGTPRADEQLRCELEAQKNLSDLVADVVRLLTTTDDGDDNNNENLKHNVDIKPDTAFWEKVDTYCNSAFPGAKEAILGVDGVHEKDWRIICLDAINLPLPLITKLVDLTSVRSLSSRRSLVRNRLGAVGLTSKQLLEEYSNHAKEEND